MSLLQAQSSPSDTGDHAWYYVRQPQIQARSQQSTSRSPSAQAGEANEFGTQIWAFMEAEIAETLELYF